MKRQINRNYRLVVGDYQSGDGIEITGLQISFDISKSSDNSVKTNSASIEVNNLSEEHLKIIDTDYPACSFEVGYGGKYKLLFGGQITKFKTRKKGTERVTQILLGAGYTELNHNVISKVVPAGSTVKDVYDEIVKSFPGVSRTVYNGTNFNNPVIKGYPISGTVREVLDKMSDTFNTEWRLDDTVLFVNDRGRGENENFNAAYVISPDSGLIEIPYRESGDIERSTDDPVKKQGVQFSMLLNPEVYPGQIIKLEDTEINGWFKVDSVRYYGSYRNGSWVQDVFCSSIEKVVKKE
jgi:hypothetical protein